MQIIRHPVTAVFVAVFGDSSSARYFKGECGLVCTGKVPCNVREVKR